MKEVRIDLVRLAETYGIELMTAEADSHGALVVNDLGPGDTLVLIGYPK